jgi:nucleoside phosphorylase
MKTSDNVDILILAPLPIEIDALREAFCDYSSKHGPDELAYDECIINGRNGSLSVRFVQLPEAGVLRAGVFATKLLLEWKPRYVVSFGIAGGFCDPKDSGEVNLEHVLLAEHVFYYELAKETKGGVEQSPEIFLTSSEFPHSLRNHPEDYKKGLPPNCRIHIGRLASGEKLIDDPKSGTRKAIKRIHRKMLGFEQEAAGIGAACQWANWRNKPGFLAVKGISDCGKNKRAASRSRVPSASNAAVVVRSLLEKTELIERFDFETINALQIAQKIEEAIGSHLAEPISIESTRLLSSKDELPIVFYRWRARENHVHWVDFYHLLLLRELRDIGIRAHILVTETSATTSQVKANIEFVTKGVLGTETQVTWYSELEKFKEQYEAHSREIGFDENVVKAIASAQDTLEVERGTFVDADWLQFIAWIRRSSMRCFVLTWERRAAFATELTKLLGLQTLALLTPDLRIGPALGKFDQPSVDLVIDPPKYESILSWLRSKPDLVYVQDLARHLTCIGAHGDDRPSSEAKALLANDLGLQRVLVDAEKEFVQAVYQLANAFSTWNSVFFSNAVASISSDRNTENSDDDYPDMPQRFI